ncbi:hypothetical protein DM860_011126 [Cuscuta australis]|uniref:Reverse transcriptase domain-containing protein n=1 Tax=Cuscuta australis TaxID=267555 RepID=A0A328DDA1_9ASTE|nr:hypothetical protein DM860_011126 [Cuscuta australis]
MWLEHKSFDNILQESWSTRVEGTRQYRLCKKLKLLKQPLRNLNKLEFGHISARAKEAREEYSRLMKELVLQPNNHDLMMKKEHLRKKANIYIDSERAFFQQKIKTQLILEGDKCTKYFHAMMRKQHGSNSIPFLTTEGGGVTSSLKEIADLFVGYYTNLFGPSPNVMPIDWNVFQEGKTINPMEAMNLSRNVQFGEVQTALFSIGDDKAPGPDGFSAAFFKKKWNVVGQNVFEAVDEFFRSGKLLKQINHATVALIPKVKDNPGVKDFRPIACSNVIYKIITKILSNRMSPLLPDLIDKAQSAFIGGRNLMDSVLLAQHLVRRYARKRSMPSCMMKVDLTKAYDTVSWSFLEKVMTGHGFPGRFVGWIIECVTTASFSLAINGGLHGFVKCGRGIRQGDPMAPTLFLFCIEYFSRLLKKMGKQRNFSYHPMCQTLEITHIAFADDLMLFSRGDLDSVGVLADALKHFSQVSGLHVNPQKSNIYLAGQIKDNKVDLLDLVQFPLGQLPVRYLGLPLTSQRASERDFAPLISKVEENIHRWSTKTLSQAGRVELIRSVIQGIQGFWLQVFPVHKLVLNRIITICRTFLWGSKFSKVAWTDICKPHEEGGLGLKDSYTWNQTFLIKNLWNIASHKDTLWVKWVHSVYLQGRNIWTWPPKKEDSHLFKRLSCVRDIMLDKCGDAQEIEDYFQSFCDGGSLSTSKIYDLIRTRNQAKPWMKFIWQTYIPPRFSFTTWIAMRRHLPTKVNLAYVEMENRNCTLCHMEMETTEHLFFSCHISAQIWNGIKSWLNIDASLSTLIRAIKWLRRQHTVHSNRKICRVGTFSTIYHIWKLRNSVYFEHIEVDIQQVIQQVKLSVYKVMYKLFPSNPRILFGGTAG